MGSDALQIKHQKYERYTYSFSIYKFQILEYILSSYVNL